MATLIQSQAESGPIFDSSRRQNDVIRIDDSLNSHRVPPPGMSFPLMPQQAYYPAMPQQVYYLPMPLHSYNPAMQQQPHNLVIPQNAACPDTQGLLNSPTIPRPAAEQCMLPPTEDSARRSSLKSAVQPAAFDAADSSQKYKAEATSLTDQQFSPPQVIDPAILSSDCNLPTFRPSSLSLEDRVVHAVHERFVSLPSKCKPPRCLHNNIEYWVPLSGIVLYNTDDGSLECVALGTGMKCLPWSKVGTAKGKVLHDWHAETVAIRAFNHFLLQECSRLVSEDDYTSPALERKSPKDTMSCFEAPPSDYTSSSSSGSGQRGSFASDSTSSSSSSASRWSENFSSATSAATSVSSNQQSTQPSDYSPETAQWCRSMSSDTRSCPFSIRPSLRIFMYCSEAPCGDASMELVMSAQEDATPWAVRPDVTGERPDGGELVGRGWFSELGMVRRKPCRGDSPYSASKSCSDKLALKQCLSLLSSVTAMLISPENAYVHTLVVPEAACVPDAFERCFGPDGRMSSMSAHKFASDLRYQPFWVKTTSIEFRHSKRALQMQSAAAAKGSNITAVWTPDLQETLINGVLQGRKQGDGKGASALSRSGMAQTLHGIVNQMPGSVRFEADWHCYSGIKAALALSGRREVKEVVTREALKGWNRNVEDEFDLGM